MNRIRTIAVALAFVACAAGAAESPSAAIRRDAPRGITEAFYACIDKAGYDTTAAGACLAQEEARQDRRLNAAYKALMGKLDAAQGRDLMEAERAWLAFRDRTARFEDTLYGGGIVDNLQLSENGIFVTCLRADRLEEYLAIANGL